MSRCGFIPLLTMLVVGVVAGQWSEPVQLPYDSLWCNYCFVVAPGDTLWALFTDGLRGQDTAVAYSSWSMGDTWSEPESIDCSELAYCAAAGIDEDGRIAFLRYDGDVPWEAKSGYGVVASVRESGGWRSLGRVLGAPGPTVQTAAPYSVAFDHDGTMYVGIDEHVHEGSGRYNSARFSRMQGDTLTWPGFIVEGDTSPHSRSARSPILAPHPDSGFWSATFVLSTVGLRTEVHVIQGDTALPFASFEGWLCDAVVDSSGRFWVVYWKPSVGLQSATFAPDSSEVHQLIIDRPGAPAEGVSMCVDGENWVWCILPDGDTSMAVVYNRGRGWSAPETVTEELPDHTCLLPDTRGRIHALYQPSFWQWYGRYRLSRPGIADGPFRCGRRADLQSIVRGVLHLPRRTPGKTEAILLDVAGRKVMDLQPGNNDIRQVAPGVYFVRRPETEDGRPRTEVRKVIIQH